MDDAVCCVPSQARLCFVPSSYKVCAKVVYCFFEPAKWGGVGGADNAWDAKPMIDEVLPCKMNGMCS